MRVLIVHNRYQQPGGEDEVVCAETELLALKGNLVDKFQENNDGIFGPAEMLHSALRCVWSWQTSHRLQDRIRIFHPDVIHIHNFFPRISPSAHITAMRAGVPVVQTLHNYRLICPAATMFRDGNPCEECLGRNAPLPAVQHGCYRHSRSASCAVANMLAVHRLFATWSGSVSRFIASSEFARAKFIAAGLPAQRITVKPNFVRSDPGLGTGRGRYALFVGRLSEEKGIDVLLRASMQVNGILPLYIAGDGSLSHVVEAAAAKRPSVHWLGWRTREEISTLLANALVLIVPSMWYEGLPLVILDAFAAGVPVIASRLGALAELISHQRTGLLFTAGDANDLARTVKWAATHPDEMAIMRLNARREFENKYTADINYEKLINIYQSVRDDPPLRKSAEPLDRTPQLPSQEAKGFPNSLIASPRLPSTKLSPDERKQSPLVSRPHPVPRIKTCCNPI